MKKFLGDYLLYCSLGLIFTAFYLLAIDKFQNKFIEFVIQFQTSSTSAIISIFLLIIGLVGVWNYFDIKYGRKTNLRELFTGISLMVFALSNWLDDLYWMVYFPGALFFWIGITIILKYSAIMVKVILIKIIKVYRELKDFEKISILIPIITVILTKILG